jgi:seryl-tRNA(Sec) selenium transferase
MRNNSSLRMAHEYAASKEAYESTTQIMSSKVSIPVSDRYNAKYGEKDLHHALTALSISNGYAE